MAIKNNNKINIVCLVKYDLGGAVYS
jgi:hypothetical protein